MTSPTTIDPLALSLPTYHVIPLWIYCFFITILSFVGNSTVLYSSLRYDSIKLDRISVLLVRNLAAADLIYTGLVVFPILVTYSAGGWVLGDGWCWAMSQLTFIPGTVNTLTVLTITLYRLKILISPFSQISLTSGRVLVGLVWLTSLLGTILSLSYGSASKFSPTAARCNSSIYRDPAGGLVFLVAATGLLIILPVFSITLGNIFIGVIALNRSASASRTKGIATVSALSGLFIVSWTPLVIFTFFRIRRMAVPSFLDLLAFHCIFLNTAGNPVLYTMTNRRFGEYVRGCAARLLCCRGSRKSQAGESRRRIALKPTIAASSTTSAPTAPSSTAFAAASSTTSAPTAPSSAALAAASSTTSAPTAPSSTAFAAASC